MALSAEMEKQLERMRHDLSKVEDLATVVQYLYFGVYFFECGVHVQCNEAAGREAHSRQSLVDGVRHVYPMCVRGHVPSRESIVMSSRRPLCTQCVALYRIDVPLGVQPLDGPGPHASESMYITSPKNEWPPNILATIKDVRNRIDTPLGPIFWSQEESSLLIPPPTPQPTSVKDITWEDVLSMKDDLEGYVNRFASDYLRIRDREQELTRGYARPAVGFPTVEEMEEAYANDCARVEQARAEVMGDSSCSSTMPFESTGRAIVPYNGGNTLATWCPANAYDAMQE